MNEKISVNVTISAKLYDKLHTPTLSLRIGTKQKFFLRSSFIMEKQAHFKDA